MRPILSIAWREVSVALRRLSFYVATFLVPALLAVILVAFAILNYVVGGRSTQQRADVLVSANFPSGYVDQAGIIRSVPGSMRRSFRAYPDEAAATTALQQGRIYSYFVIAPDYLTSGRVARVSRQAAFVASLTPDTPRFETLLRFNLTGDETIAQRLSQRQDFAAEIVGSAAEGGPAGGEAPAAQIAIQVALLLAFSIMNAAGWQVQGVAEERESRMIEIVMTSIQPWQLMAGKLLGFSLISLLQIGIWLTFSGSIWLATASPDMLDAIPASFWGWTLTFFLLGFLFFGALMTGLGALGATMRESAQVSIFLMLPMLLPLWFSGTINGQPNSGLALGFGLVPFTAPLTMVLRVGSGNVPVSHLIGSVVTLVIAVMIAIWIAARLFHGATLLAGIRLTPRAIWHALCT